MTMVKLIVGFALGVLSVSVYIGASLYRAFNNR